MTTARQVAAAPVRAHIQDLVDQGMTQAAICRAAPASSACVSSLLHGQFNASRTPVQTISADAAERLLAVRFEKSALKASALLCAPGERFEPVGYRVGRCCDCGQLAPVQASHKIVVMNRHLRPETGVQEPGGLPAPAVARHPDCGTTKGVGRHRRERTDLCGPCRYVTRGYDAGYKAATTKAARDARSAIPAELVEAVVKAMRAFLHRRPYPQLRELARTVVQIADAELAADDESEAA